MTNIFVKRSISTNYLCHILTRAQPTIYTQICGYGHDINTLSISNGPVSDLKQKIARGELANDPHQMKVVQMLESIYQDVHDYKPQQLNLLEKWLGGKRKEAPKGLYIYGAVGGGKTMLMDLFYNCCQVSQVAVCAKNIAYWKPA